MTDTTTTEAVLSDAPWIDMEPGDLLIHIQSLQARLDQAHWDAISRDQTIENLRGEVGRLREVLAWYADWEHYKLIHDVRRGDPEFDREILADTGDRARAVLARMEGAP